MREQQRELERCVQQLRAVIDYHLLLHQIEEYQLQWLTGLIHAIVNTVINFDFSSTVHLDSYDFISLVLTHENHQFPKR